MAKQIVKEAVEFDRWGMWSHSAIHELDEKYDEVPFKDIPDFARLELMPIRIWDDDKIAILHGPDGDNPPDFRKWQPDPPDGDGWFPFSFSEDEDGPWVMYARPKVA